MTTLTPILEPSLIHTEKMSHSNLTITFCIFFWLERHLLIQFRNLKPYIIQIITSLINNSVILFLLVFSQLMH